MKLKRIGLLVSLTVTLVFFACGTGNEATDSAGNEDQEIFDQAISAAAGAPNTTISATVRPPDPSASSIAKFKFSCTTPPCTFNCQLDGGAWKTCSSPTTYKKLWGGAHVFRVKATANGKTDRTPDSYDWNINNVWAATKLASAPSARR